MFARAHCQQEEHRAAALWPHCLKDTHSPAVEELSASKAFADTHGALLQLFDSMIAQSAVAVVPDQHGLICYSRHLFILS